MTEDTKRALEIIEPLAKELRIEISADNSLLFCNGQPIGIGCNSTWATLMEFIGYAFLMVWAKDKSVPVRGAVLERIKRYWLSKDQYAKIMEARRMAGDVRADK